MLSLIGSIGGLVTCVETQELTEVVIYDIMMRGCEAIAAKGVLLPIECRASFPSDFIGNINRVSCLTVKPNASSTGSWICGRQGKGQ